MKYYKKYKRCLYHSYKNENALPYVIIGTVLLIPLRDNIEGIISLWLWYYFYCLKNNDALNKDPDVLASRKYVKELEKKYKDKI